MQNHRLQKKRSWYPYSNLTTGGPSTKWNTLVFRELAKWSFARRAPSSLTPAGGFGGGRGQSSARAGRVKRKRGVSWARVF